MARHMTGTRTTPRWPHWTPMTAAVRYRENSEGLKAMDRKLSKKTQIAQPPPGSFHLWHTPDCQVPAQSQANCCPGWSCRRSCRRAARHSSSSESAKASRQATSSAGRMRDEKKWFGCSFCIRFQRNRTKYHSNTKPPTLLAYFNFVLRVLKKKLTSHNRAKHSTTSK